MIEESIMAVIVERRTYSGNRVNNMWNEDPQQHQMLECGRILLNEKK